MAREGTAGLVVEHQLRLRLHLHRVHCPQPFLDLAALPVFGAEARGIVLGSKTIKAPGMAAKRRGVEPFMAFGFEVAYSMHDA